MTDTLKEDIQPLLDPTAIFTFSSKDQYYGQRALAWRYDNTIIKWFDMWGHPLARGGQTDFEKSIIQTNWCDTQSHNMEGDYSRLGGAYNVDNFMSLVAHFEPSVVLFMGSQLIHSLNNPVIRAGFEKIMGNCVKEPEVIQKAYSGIRFKVTFQSFERSQVICFPHPSSSRGLSDEYIGMFSSEMDRLLTDYKISHFEHDGDRDEFERQMKKARQIMSEDRDMLAKLAKV